MPSKEQIAKKKRKEARERKLLSLSDKQKSDERIRNTQLKQESRARQTDEDKQNILQNVKD